MYYDQSYHSHDLHHDLQSIMIGQQCCYCCRAQELSRRNACHKQAQVLIYTPLERYCRPPAAVDNTMSVKWYHRGIAYNPSQIIKRHTSLAVRTHAPWPHSTIKDKMPREHPLESAVILSVSCWLCSQQQRATK